MAGGTFFGYRELEIVLDAPRPRLKPQDSPSPVNFKWDGIPGYAYFARNGDAPEDFPDDWIELPFSCRLATWTLRGGPLEVQVSFDGEAVGDVRVYRGSVAGIDTFRAYRVRVLVPGFAVWYQLMAII